MREPIDWSKFDGEPESTCHCRCGAVFRSHAKVVADGGRFFPRTRKPCPGCGETGQCYRIASDPERFEVQ